MHNLRKTYLAFGACGLLFAQVACAQTLPDPVQYIVAPEVPGPQTQVTIEAQGVGGFLGDTQVTWRQDGVVTKQGAGESRYTFTTKALGKTTTVQVTIASQTQGTFTRTFTFNPSALNLVWEADTTVPPFYTGKALWSAGSPLRIVALPVVYAGGNRVAASALSYQWSLNDEPQPNKSGLGRAAFAFIGDQFSNRENISVDAYYGAALVAHGEITVSAAAPALVLYQRDALRGLVLDTAFPSSISLLGKEITVQAQPFYFSGPDYRSGNVTYAWQLNGGDATGPEANAGILTLRQTGSGEGSAQINVTLQNYGADTFVQQASAVLNLLFGHQNSLLNGIFGL